MPVDRVTVVEPLVPKGGVVVLQEAFGVTPYLLGVAGRLAAAGWTAAVPHLYHRSGSPAFAYDVNHGDGVDGREPAAEQAAAAAIGPARIAVRHIRTRTDLPTITANKGRIRCGLD